MPRLLLDHSDGHYSTRLLDDTEALQLEAQGVDIAHVENRVYDAYLRHCEQDGIWQALWRSISNEQYLRRREKELLPLEEADREIARLREELARAERMKCHFEDEYLRAIGRQPRSEHDNDGDFTCIYPQPGCEISLLESAEWQAAATKILQTYNATRGTPYQGCCCGHTHKQIDAETAKRLRAAGFHVENDVEID